MAALSITTNAPKVSRVLVVDYDFGANLEEATAKFGAEVVFSNFKQNAVIGLQALVRRNLEAKDDKYKDDAAIIAAVANWKPGVATVKTTDKKALVMDAIGKMSAEERKALLEQLLAAAE